MNPLPILREPRVPQTAILVVDDDDAVRELVALGLRRAGFEVFEAPGGMTALDIVRDERIGLVVLDLHMPGMSGMEVIETLRSRSQSATLPVLLMTGSGDPESVIDGLGAGADDFVAKPVRLLELVARVHAHLRKQTAWSHVVEDELRTRTRVVEALGRIAISSVPDEAAETLVRELSTRIDSDVVSVLQVGAGGRLHELATYERSKGVRRGGHPISPAVAVEILERARAGPWVEEVTVLPTGEPKSPIASTFTSSVPELAAGSPIYAGDDLVGILTIGISREGGASPFVRRARLLAAAIDYASVLSTMAGSAFADGRDIAAARVRLGHVLSAHEFHPVFQPIVDLRTGSVVGFEGLTRFDDGTPPDVRFAEAMRGDLGDAFELATIRATLDGGAALPDGLFLSLNVSPDFVQQGVPGFRQLIRDSIRPLVLELTEHLPIEDYDRVRRALGKLGHVGLAVDDAGAGYASLRHILELRPTYAKLDVSLVRGVDADDVRQAMAAGLQYFASRTGCRLIAEGVETTEEAEILRRLGIEFAQGYLFGRPTLVAA